MKHEDFKWEVLDSDHIDGVDFTLYERGGTFDCPKEYKATRKEGNYLYTEYYGEMKQDCAVARFRGWVAS